MTTRIRRHHNPNLDSELDDAIFEAIRHSERQMHDHFELASKMVRKRITTIHDVHGEDRWIPNDPIYDAFMWDNIDYLANKLRQRLNTLKSRELPARLDTPRHRSIMDHVRDRNSGLDAIQDWYDIERDGRRGFVHLLDMTYDEACAKRDQHRKVGEAELRHADQLNQYISIRWPDGAADDVDAA